MKHHYVPQFLLRRWANEAGKLQVFAIRNGRLVCSELAPEYTGFEIGLYAIVANALGFSEDHIEKKLFGPIDNDAAKVLEKLERHEAITVDEHIAWTFFLSSLRVRQPDALDFLRTEGAKLLRHTLAEQDKATLPKGLPTTQQWLDRHFPGALGSTSLTSWLPRMIAHPEVMEAFGGVKWWFREFEPDAPKLLLSDLPIHSEGGLKDADFSIMLPIAPNRVFFGTRSAQTEQFLTQMAPAELIERVNRATLASSTDRIWASSRPDAQAFIEANLDAIGKNVVTFRSLARWTMSPEAAPL